MFLKQINNLDEFSTIAQAHIGVWGSKEWLSIYDNLSVIGIYNNDQLLIGGFYYLATKKMGMSFAKLPPYSPHCGLFFNYNGKNTSSIHTFTKEIIEEIASYFDQKKYALFISAFPFSITDLQPFIWKKYKVIPNYTYRINLTQSVEVIKSNYDSKNRNAINKALNSELTVFENKLSNTELHDFFYSSLQKTKANIYTDELKNIFTKFSNAHNSFSFSAFKSNELVGTVFCIYDKETCYYLLGGVNKEFNIQGVNNLLLSKSIEKAKDLGCNVFDFEGSMLKGVEKFFRGFGGQLVPYFTVNKAILPLEIVLKFKKRNIF